MEPRQERSRRTFERIMSAVLQEFEDYGYARASFGSIAKRAGMGKGLVSYYFPAKTDMADAVLARAFPDGVFMAAETDESVGPLEVLIQSVESVAQSLLVSQVARVAIRLQADSEYIGPRQPTPYIGWIQRTRECLERAVEVGDLPAGVDVESEAILLVATFVGLRDIAKRLPDSTRIVRLAITGTVGRLKGMGAHL